MVSAKPILAKHVQFPHVRVVQDHSGNPEKKEQQDCLKSATETPVIAFVERDAPIEEAAKALVFARLVRGGKAPYAPDVVLVNEWVKKPFLEAVLRQQFALGSQFESDTKHSQSFTKEYESERGAVSVVSSGANGAVIEVHERCVR